MLRYFVASSAALAASFLLCLGVAGCSSDDTSGHSTFAGDAPARASGASSGLSADAGGAGDARTDVKVPQTLSDEACSNLAEQSSEALYNDSLDPYDSDEACTTDDDCVFVDDSTKCTSSCGVVLNEAGARALATSVASQNAGACEQFAAGGCPPEVYSCGSPPPGAQCIMSRCVGGYPAAWVSLSIESDTGGTGSVLPIACSGTDCTTWKVTPDATITTTTSSGTTTKKLSAGDFATVDGILRDPTFRQEELNGTTCNAPVGDQHVSIAVDHGTAGVSGAEITTCVTGGPAGNDYLALYDVLKDY